MATQMRVNPDEWNEFFDIWFLVHPDPLAGPAQYTVTVHRSTAGRDVWFEVHQPNGGVRVQTRPPDLIDIEGARP